MALEREAAVASRVAELREQVRVLTAELHGAQAELEALRAGSASVEPLASLERSDAIRAVLRSVDVSLSPSELRERLVEAGRSDRLNEITATLKYLLDKEVIQRPERGRYLAV
ncbi:MAG: hypothetical protein U5K29_13985 [Acidimicrobiales bacterium]|nr:hypothetical protein [Acidimicrobiales bacterium]